MLARWSDLACWSGRLVQLNAGVLVWRPADLACWSWSGVLIWSGMRPDLIWSGQPL